MRPALIIEAFDQHLSREGLEFEATVIGGSALVLLGIISRETKDCDVLAPDLPDTIREAADVFARRMRAAGNALSDGWLNDGPKSLRTQLPPGWQARVQPLFQGQALRLTGLGRGDLLRTKLFAYCDRDLDLPDCIALNPTAEELKEAEPWVAYQDANPQWPEHVRRQLERLARRLGHAV